MLQFLPVLYGKQKTAVSVGVRFKPPLHMFFSLFIRFKPVNGLSEVGEAFFVFRYYISLKIAVMQIKRNVLYCKAVFRKFLYGIFKEVHIVRFLMYFAVRGHKPVKYRKKPPVSQTVICIFFLRKRAGKIQINPVGNAVGKILGKIFRRAFYETQIRYVFPDRLFCGNDNYVCTFFNGNIIYVRIPLCNLGGKLSLSAADLYTNGIGISEPFFKVDVFLFLYRRVEIFILALNRKDDLAAVGKPFVKVLFSSHSHSVRSVICFLYNKLKPLYSTLFLFCRQPLDKKVKTIYNSLNSRDGKK